MKTSDLVTKMRELMNEHVKGLIDNYAMSYDELNDMMLQDMLQAMIAAYHAYEDVDCGEDANCGNGHEDLARDWASSRAGELRHLFKN